MLTVALIMQPPDWNLPFELMCDASDYAVCTILGKHKDKKPYVIYYASQSLNNAQINIQLLKKNFWH